MLRTLVLYAGAVAVCFAQAAQVPQGTVSGPVSIDRNLASVEGRVIDAAGQPVGDVSITMVLTRAPGDTQTKVSVREVQTDYRGTFSIPNLEAGVHFLMIQKVGYLLLTSLPGNGGGPLIDPITLSAAEHKTGVTFRLQAVPKISGRITDDQGNPVKAEIQYIKKTFGAALPLLQDAKTQFGRDGNFTITGLQPGRYYLRFILPATDDTKSADNAALSDVETYYPGVDRLSDATALQLVADRDITGLEIRMQKAFRAKVAGRLADLDKLGDATGSVYLAPLDAAEMTTQGIPVVAGQFEFSNVAPGRYLIATRPYLLKNDREVEHPLVAQAVVTVGKADLRDVVLPSDPVSNIAGNIGFQDLPAAFKAISGNYSVEIRSVVLPSTFLFSARGGTDGSFQFAGVPAGDYSFVLGAPRGVYPMALRFNGQDILGSTLHVNPGANQRLEAVIGFGKSQITGVVRDRNQMPATGVHVSAWAQRPMLDGSNRVLVTDVTKASGEFSLRDLPPGEYSVLAWEGIEDGIDGVPEFRSKFMSKETTVVVKEGESYTLNPPLIPRSKSDPEAAAIR